MRIDLRHAVFCVAVALGHLSSIDSSIADEKPTATRTVRNFSLPDIQGKTQSADEWREAKGIVLFILGTECPVANGYAPLMQRLANAYGPRGIVFYGVHPDPDVTAELAAKHAEEYGLKFPVLLDGGQKVVAQTGARVLGQAVLLAPRGQVLYQGRIDDRYAENGKRRDEARMNDLEIALEAVLAGKLPPVTETKAFGCPLPRTRSQKPGVREQESGVRND